MLVDTEHEVEQPAPETPLPIKPTRLHPRDQSNFLDRYEWAASLGFKTPPRMVLVAMVYRDGQGKGVWASQKTLAGDAGMCVTAIKKHLKFLLGEGAIERDESRVGKDGGRATVMYRPIYPFGRNVKKATTSPSQNGRQVVNTRPAGRRNTPTNHEGNHEQNLQSALKPPVGGSAEVIEGAEVAATPRGASTSNSVKNKDDGGWELCGACKGAEWVDWLGRGIQKCPKCVGG